MRHATTFAVVPVKALGLAKRRLAPALPDAARHRLVLTMLEDILTAAVSVEGIARILVVTPDLEAAAPLVDAVFGNAPKGRAIPYTITGRPGLARREL